MAEVDIRHHNATAEGAAVALGVALILFGGVLVAPGAVVVFAVDRLAGLSLECAQLWTFAIVGSVTIAVVLSVAAGSAAAGARRFFALALAVTALVMIARFGFHAVWPDRLWDAFAGRGGA